MPLLFYSRMSMFWAAILLLASLTTSGREPSSCSKESQITPSALTRSSQEGYPEKHITFLIDAVTDTQVVIRVNHEKGAPNYCLSVERAGKAQQEISLDVVPMLGDDFQEHAKVETCDLDGDGRREILVSYLSSVSNGMGVEYTNLLIFDGQDLRRPPSKLEVQDYEIYGGLQCVGPPYSWRILETRWKGATDGKRGWGLYLVGRWLKYSSGQLIPDPLRPSIGRRLLYGFAKERDELLSSSTRKASPWYRSPHAFVVANPESFFEDWN